MVCSLQKESEREGEDKTRRMDSTKDRRIRDICSPTLDNLVYEGYDAESMQCFPNSNFVGDQYTLRS
jgi:hypothetical protein